MGLHGLFDSLQILFQLHDVLPGLGNRLAQGHIVGVGDILLQIADGFTFRNDKGPVVVVLFAHEALEQRRLPGPVGPDEADPFAPADFKTHIMEYRMHSKRLTQFLYFNTTHLYNPALPGILTTKQKRAARDSYLERLLLQQFMKVDVPRQDPFSHIYYTVNPQSSSRLGFRWTVSTYYGNFLNKKKVFET